MGGVRLSLFYVACIRIVYRRYRPFSIVFATSIAQHCMIAENYACVGFQNLSSNLIPMFLSTRLLCLSTLVMLWFPSVGMAQSQPYDVIYYSGGESSHCHLVDVAGNTVRYRSLDAPDGEIYDETRDDMVLIVKHNGNFLLPAESGGQWKAGANPDFDNIVTEDSQVLSAHDIEEHEDIIYYHDALDSTEGSVRTDEVMAVIYQDGGHRLFADVNEVAYALGGALAFALPADSAAGADAIASTESMSAPLPEDSPADTSSASSAEEESSARGVLP